MNLIDAEIVEILSEPFERFDKWWVRVKVNEYGTEGYTHVMKDTKEEIKQIKIGDIIQI